MAKTKHHVYSTLSSDMRYATYAPGGADMQIEADAVFIAGKVNVADARLITPRGAVTTVTAEQLELLEANPVFRLHRENGFVSVSTAAVDPEVAAADMAGRDKSAPLVDADLADTPALTNAPDTKAAPARGRKA